MPPHAQIEAWWKDYRCNTTDLVSLNFNGRYPVRLQRPLEAAGIAFSERLMASGYRTPMGPTGSYNCRKIGGTDTWSLHAYAVAIDWDYAINPYLRGEQIPRGFDTDIRFELTEANIGAVESIVNSDGDSIWKWAGYTIGDTMHFQVDVPPDKCQPIGDDTMDLERWATRLRNPEDFDQMAIKGLITEAERDYWKTVATDAAEYQDLRDAVEVRKDLW